MNILTILLIAIALAMDAFAVAIASGVTIKNMKVRHAITVGMWFGLFQALMPLLGWLGGMELRGFIGGLGHWIAFVLLVVIGVKMIYESVKIELIEKKADPLNIYILFMLSIATSIDALAAGLSFAMVKVFIVMPALLIGLVTFLMSFGGVWIGHKCGHLFEKKIGILGGVLLIAIGGKILIEHLLA